MRSLRWLPGAQEGGKGSEKYKHKYNYKILAQSLILSVMNYKKLFIKIETPSIRSPTAFFSLQKISILLLHVIKSLFSLFHHSLAARRSCPRLSSYAEHKEE